uniref:Uncharacterized protein n=1 Tax=Vitis vinifera TaxID=29760 RepID=F6HNR3_VITVI
MFDSNDSQMGLMRLNGFGVCFNSLYDASFKGLFSALVV